MDAAMVDMVAGPQPGRGWDGGGGGGADTMLGLAGAGALLSVCYLEAFDPYGDLILLEASDDLLPDLLQGRDLRIPGASSEGLLIKYARRPQPSASADHISLLDDQSILLLPCFDSGPCYRWCC